MFKLIASIAFVGIATYATTGTDTNTGAPCTTTVTAGSHAFTHWVASVGGSVDYHANGTWTNSVGNVIGYSDEEDSPICAY